MSGRILIGIDVGLSFLKVAAFDERGQLVARGSRPYDRCRPAPGRVEEDADQWITSSADLVREFLASGAFRADQVAGLSVSGRGSGAVFVDDEGRTLAPHWLDGRHRAEAAWLRERFGRWADARALASKTLHLAEQHPDLFARLKHPLFVKDFILYRLTGEVATDPSSGPRDLIWSKAMWEAVGVPLEHVPVVRPHTEIGGYLQPEAAALFGLPPGLPVGIGGHDGACANTGAGAIADGQVCLTLGTNGVARSISAKPPPIEPVGGISIYHFLPGLWCRGGDAAFLGHSPTWLATLLKEGHDPLEEQARRVAPGAGGVTFLPFLGGEICPEGRPERRAVLLGMHATTGEAELYRATLEGGAGLVRLIADRLAEHGLGGGEWRVSGGGTNSALWMDIIAAMLDRPLFVGEPEECTRGACMFLAVALGWHPSVDACAAEWVRTTRVVEPDQELTRAYEAVLNRFRYLSDAVYNVERQAMGAPEVASAAMKGEAP